MSIVQYNGVDFDIKLILVIDENTSFELKNDSIGQMLISNDMYNGYSTLNFTYTEQYDKSYFKSVVSNNTTAVILSIKQMTIGYDRPIELLYVIDECRLQQNNVNEQMYRIKAVESNNLQMQSRSSYFSSTKDPISIIREITKTAKPMSKWDNIDVSEAEKEQQRPFLFVSKTNETVIGQINRILDQMSDQDAIFYMVFNCFLSKYRIIKLSRTNFNDRTNYIRIIPSSMHYTLGDISTFTNFEKMEGTSPTMSYNNYCNIYADTFDTKNRKWERKKIGGIEEIEKAILPSDDYEFIFKEQKQQEKEQFMFVDEYSTNIREILGKRNKFWMLYGQRVKASLIGDLSIELGNFVTITDNFLEDYGGVWMISEVKHWFEKEKFTTTITLSRGFRLKPEVIQRGNEQQ